MTTSVVLGFSTLLQFIAAFLAFRLIRVTGRRGPWTLIALAVTGMGVRRTITLFRVFSGDLSRPPDLTAELVALFISILMVAGVAWIAPLFLEIQRSKEALRKSEERFKRAVRGTSDGLWDLDLVTNKIWFAPQFKKLLGYEDDEFPDLLESWSSRLHPDDRENERNAILQHLKENDPYDVEYRLRAKSGEYRWFRARAVAIRSDAGIPIRLSGSIQDITERRRTEGILRNVAQGVSTKIGEAFFQSMVSYLAKTLEMDYAFVSALTGPEPGRASTLSVWSHGEIALNFSYDLAHTPCDDAVHQRKCIYPSGVREAFPLDELAKELGVESYAGISLLDSADQVIGLLVAMDGKPMANPGTVDSLLRIFAVRAAAELERKLAEEARQRLEEQLRQSQKMEAIGQLAGGVAHDFNNLLTGILGNVELVLHETRGRDAQGADLVKDSLEQIQDAGEQAASLTRQLLAFGRREVIKPEIIEPNKVFLDMKPMLSRLIGEKVELEAELSSEVMRIRADDGQLKRVFMNLVVNARDAMPEGGRILLKMSPVVVSEQEAATMPDANPGPHVLIEVSDTGIGMSPATRERIFEPFYTTKPMGKGTGLGLSTVYGIVTQSGGHISVQSEPQQGSTFQIFLPIVANSVVESDRSKSADIEGGHETILICEDHEQVRKLLSQMLESGGYRVLVTKNGPQALEVVSRHDGRIDLVVTDVIMPGMDGGKLAEALHQEQPDLPVLFVSGYTAEVLDQDGVSTRGDAFLQKPYRRDEVLRKVREMLDGQAKPTPP